MTESETTSKLPWWRANRVFTVLVGVAAAGLVVAVLLIVKSVISDDDDAHAAPSLPADAGALVAARQEALNFFTLDYQHADENVEKVLALATGEFKEQYAAKRAELVAQIKKEKVVTTATIPEGGVAVEYVNGNQVQILVAVDVEQPSGVQVFAARNRARVVLVKVDGRWLVSGVNQVG